MLKYREKLSEQEKCQCRRSSPQLTIQAKKKRKMGSHRLIYIRRKNWGVYLLLVLQLGDLSLDGMRTVLAGNHSLEAVEIGHVGAGGTGLRVLRGSRGGPLAGKVELLSGLLNLGGTGTTLDGDDELSEGDTLQVDDLARDSVGRTIDDDAVTINNLNDDGDLALLFTLVDLNNATNLHETGEESLFTSNKSSCQSSVLLSTPQTTNFYIVGHLYSSRSPRTILSIINIE